MTEQRLDSIGNVLPPNLFQRGKYYTVKKMMNGVEKKMSTGKTDFKSALRRYYEIMKAWNDGESGWTSEADVPSFADYFKTDYRPTHTVLKTPARGTAANPVYRDDSLVKSFLNFVHKTTKVANLPMDRVTATMAQAWANFRRNDTYTRKVDGPTYPISEGTVSREIAMIQAVFQQAIVDKLIEDNPFEHIHREPYSSREDVLSLDDQARLFAVLSPRFQRWVTFMIGTGLRIAEGIGVNQVTDLDFAKRHVTVTRKTRGKKKKVQDVPIIDSYVLDILQEQMTLEGGLWVHSQNWFRSMLTRAATRAGIKHLSPHTLRHTFATRYLQGKGDIYVLSQILGHSTVSTTEKVYAHLLTDDLHDRSKGVKLGLRPAEPGKVLPFPQASGA